MVDKTLNIGLVGYGYSGRIFHAPFLSTIPGFYLKKVVERHRQDSKKKYPWVEVVKDVEQVYQDPDIDVVVITTPSTDHVSFVCDALLAGKHVVVEKPFTPKSEDARYLTELAKAHGKMLSVYHNRRWDGDFRTISSLINNHWLGELKSVSMSWEGFAPTVTKENWRESSGEGAGILYDLGVHLLDQAVCLFGLPESLYADVDIQRDGGSADDYYDITLYYANHLKVNLHSSRIAKKPSPRYILHGTKGSFVKSGTDPQEAALNRGEVPTGVHWGKESAAEWGLLCHESDGMDMETRIETKQGSYSSYYQNIYDHLIEGADLAVKAEEALRLIQVIELAYQSSKEGRKISLKEAGII
ncbi:Gfo/Idh/MocA family oxidoreductase [Gracilibacillus alcaliphilus]|uniref:Gfo/Idh/MocA family oxidoreductase n=1 Tax=Gracilibacillus alcaliphilus TaxID=1401441 RepID=UPI00195AFF1F|nr:Gfo/Idh/MocA family oxidoreductase [Gracilibacillus alcaliphilus]MBM7675634.1 putative dehydrogenase [Gracilibacillus alcaliphilus]